MKRIAINSTSDSVDRSLQCPNCDSARVQTHLVIDRFMFGVGADAVQLSVEIPAYRCVDCKLEFSGEEAERLRHRAVCDHLRLLSPERIAETRAKYDLSRAKFAAVSRIGMATLARWENGETLQNAAMDVYMRLLSRPLIYELVASGAVFEEPKAEPKTAQAASEGGFRVINKLDPAERTRLAERSRHFRLHGVAA